MRQLLLVTLVATALGAPAHAYAADQVGLVFARDVVHCRWTIYAVHPAGPAQATGARNGDLLRSVDGQDASRMVEGRLAELLRGKRGSSVTLVLAGPGGEEKRVAVERRDYRDAYRQIAREPARVADRCERQADLSYVEWKSLDAARAARFALEEKEAQLTRALHARPWSPPPPSAAAPSRTAESGMKMCPHCNGRGGNQQKCKKGNGSGRTWRLPEVERGQTLVECGTNSRGRTQHCVTSYQKVLNEGGAGPCPACSGRGYHGDACSHCKGTGSIPR